MSDMRLMNYSSVQEFFQSNGWLVPTYDLISHVFEVNGHSVIRASAIKQKLIDLYPEDGVQMFREMECHVSTHCQMDMLKIVND